MLWAWPDAAWQTTLSDIEAVDRVLNHGLGGQLWIGVGGEHAVTGYRWFQYLNAEFFGLNAQVELYAYFSLTLTLALVIGARIFRDLDRNGSAWPARLLAFSIPAVLASLEGAGSRGMEIGQFTGMTLFVILALLVDTQTSTRVYSIITIISVPTATILVLGSYAGAPAIALALVSVLQFFRPTIERQRRVKLFTLAGTFVASLAAWLLLMWLLPPSELDNRLGEFTQQVSHDPAFIPKYFLGGAAGSMISLQTLEVSGRGAHFAYAVGMLAVLVGVVAIILAHRRAWLGSTVPLLLVLMPVCLVATLVVARSSDPLWMLSPWYGFHLHLYVVGAIWLLVRSYGTIQASGRPRISRGVLAQVLGLALLGGVLGVTGFANVNQWQREPAERSYFENVQRSLLFPQTLVTGGDGLTQLVQPINESRRAVEILRQDHLSVYRDPQAVLHAMGDARSYDVAAAAQSSLVIQGMLDETWAGAHIRISVLSSTCTTLHIDVTPYPAAAGQTSLARGSDPLTVTSNFGASKQVSLGESKTTLELHPVGTSPEVYLDFGETWVPAELGVGADKRALAAVMEASCG
ncbi:MAG TPA: hypothetical protein VGK17_19230 [Propionicimonas sp.]|jgi:hypothetical protein